MMDDMAREESDLNFSASLDNNTRINYGAVKVTSRETFGTVGRHTDSTPLIPSGSQTTRSNETKYVMEQET